MVRWVHISSVVKAPLNKFAVSNDGPQERNSCLAIQRTGVDVLAIRDKEFECFTRRIVFKVGPSVMALQVADVCALLEYVCQTFHCVFLPGP